MDFLPFEEARNFVRNLKLKNQAEWTKYLKSGRKPDYIPYKPERAYRGKWINLGDWLGTGTIANQNRKYRSFNEALKFAHSLNLKGQLESRERFKQQKIPSDIPSHPDRAYKKNWKGWGHWLGTGRIANQDLKYRTFDEARTFVHHLKLKSRNEWVEFCKSGKKPEDIPYQALQTYSEKWKGWGDWLGTGTIASFDRKFLPFEEARQSFVPLN